MSTADSVSEWLDAVKAGDDAAATKLWDRCFSELILKARACLRNSPVPADEAEDVASSAFTSLVLASRTGRYPELAGRESLWRLLSKITRNKCTSRIRRVLSPKHGGGEVRELEGLLVEATEEVTPQMLAEWNDVFRHLLDILVDKELQQIAVAKIEGHTNKEIAENLELPLRTVERRLKLIRGKWEGELPA